MNTQEPRYDVLVVGGSGVDTIVRVDTLPVPPADSVWAPPIKEWAGQTGGNVALGSRALGAAVKFLDYIGDDWIGAMVRERMAKGDVDFEPLISAAGTRRAVNLVDASGRRMSFYDGRDPLDLRMPREFYLPICAGPAMSICRSRTSRVFCTTTSRRWASPSRRICTTGTGRPSTTGSSRSVPTWSSSARPGPARGSPT